MTEEMLSNSKSKKKASPYSIVLVWGLIVSCIAMNIATVLYQYGTFNSWITLSSPPSGAKTIVDAQFSQVLVESRDGKTFRAFIHFYCEQDPACRAWEPSNGSLEVSDRFSSVIKRSNNCETLQPGIFPFNPKGELAECVHVSYSGSDFLEEGYFALMASGDIFYWHNFHSTFTSKEYFIFSSLFFPIIVAIIISLAYVIIRIASQISSRSRKAAYR